MQHRVDTVHLTVRDSAGREGHATRSAERFTRDVLERFSQIVEAASPGRVVLIRSMAVRWSLSEAEMADLAVAENCAAGLADSIAANEAGSSHTTDTMATFDDEAGWLAAYLRARAAGAAGAWFYAVWRDAERPGGSADESPLRREIVLAALSRLQAIGKLVGVLAALPPETLAILAAILESGAAAMQGGSPDAAWSDDSGKPVPEHAEAAGRGLASTTSLVSSPVANTMEAMLIAAVAAAAQRTEGGSHQPTVPASPLTPSVSDGLAGPATRFGGLFYLLSRALELGIGESLWKVCLPEGLILAHAIGALLGHEAASDPAPAMFGGVTADDMLACPPVTPEQQAEVSVELLAATADALLRHRVEAVPEVFLDLLTSPAGRMLVASGLGPFALFAWPAHDARATATGVAAFLSVWPGSFPPPRARDVLLGLDTSGRLRPVSGPMARTVPLLAAAPTAPATALLSQICGAVAELFVLRAGDTVVGVSDFVSRYLFIPGHVALEPEKMTIALPMGAIDLAVRRAALDRDPGWVAWLGRTARIEFVPQGRGDVV